MIEIIDILFAAPGALLALLELLDRFHKRKLQVSVPEELPHSPQAQYESTKSIEIKYENRKTILQIISIISLVIAVVITFIEFYTIKTPPEFIKTNWIIPTAITHFFNKFLLSVYHFAEKCLFFLIGVSVFAIFHYIILSPKKRLYFVTYIILLFSSISISWFWDSSAFSDIALIYNNESSLLQSLIPYAILVTCFFSFIAILQLIQMLYLPTKASKYLKEQINGVARTLFIPLALICLSIYWAYLL